MKKIFYTFFFQIVCIIIFGILYWYYSNDFTINSMVKSKKGMLEYFYTSVTVQSGVGYSILTPNNNRAMSLLMIQQLLMIFSNILILYLFSLHLLSKGK
jgi:hypothetical protein